MIGRPLQVGHRAIPRLFNDIGELISEGVRSTSFLGGTERARCFTLGGLIWTRFKKLKYYVLIR